VGVARRNFNYPLKRAKINSECGTQIWLRSSFSWELFYCCVEIERLIALCSRLSQMPHTRYGPTRVPRCKYHVYRR